VRNPYPVVPNDVLASVDSVRASLPNEYCDPKLAAQLFEECLDEYLLCDDVVMEFHEQVGGFGHLILMGRSGFMAHAEAEQGICRFAKEVLPRLTEVSRSTWP
jgi:hypothetical protein